MHELFILVLFYLLSDDVAEDSNFRCLFNFSEILKNLIFFNKYSINFNGNKVCSKYSIISCVR